MKNSTREDECKTVFADIRKGAFYPIFQPIYGLQHGHKIGAEVLTRWNTPRCIEKSFRCIEEEGYANFFTKQLFKKLSTCLDELPESIGFISVNIPPSYLSSLSFFADVLPLLNVCKRMGSTLWLELTEQTQYPTEVCDKLMFKINLQLCQNLGVKIALDDFGRDNHKNESIIRYVSPDVVKLDRSLLRRQGIQYEKFWQRLASWRHQYKFDLVAEGIETSDELNFMQSLDVSYAQGYYLHRPSMVSDLCPKLSKPNSNHGSSAMWA